MALYKIKGTILRWEKIINAKKFLLRAIWFFEKWFPYPVKFGVNMTCENGDLMFENLSWEYIQSPDQRIMQLCVW